MASRADLSQSVGMDLDSNQIWASVLWGSIGSGYLIYGWRQKSGIPLAGGVAITLAYFLPAVWMSLASIASMFAVWWLLKRCY